MGNVPERTRTSLFVGGMFSAAVSYLDLPLSHDLVHNLVVVLVEQAFVVTVLVAQDPQELGALQLNLKLLVNDTHTDRRVKHLLSLFIQ